jgi:hypothetical protein
LSVVRRGTGHHCFPVDVLPARSRPNDCNDDSRFPELRLHRKEPVILLDSKIAIVWCRSHRLGGRPHVRRRRRLGPSGRADRRRGHRPRARADVTVGISGGVRDL